MPGIIVAFEGLPGCGKSSIAKKVAEKIPDCVVMPEVSEMAASRGFEVADRASIGTETGSSPSTTREEQMPRGSGRRGNS